MPSFDVVSEVDMHEVTNALDQANKELTNRYDLKKTGSVCRREDNVITVISDDDFHLEQVMVVPREVAQIKATDLEVTVSFAAV